MPLQWARTQNNLGSALSALGKSERDNTFFDEAVAALRASLDVLTRECAPVEWAQMQVNLGAALLGRAEKQLTTGYGREAIAATLAGLEELSYETSPLTWGHTSPPTRSTFVVIVVLPPLQHRVVPGHATPLHRRDDSRLFTDTGYLPPHAERALVFSR